jgi:DNA-binding GntR family transcriptional regulator
MPRTDRSREVEAEIMALITSGHWSIGTHAEISVRFRCSRSDVNRALISLRDLGLVKAVGEERGPNRAVVCANNAK